MIFCCGRHCPVGKGTHLDCESSYTTRQLSQYNTLQPPHFVPPPTRLSIVVKLLEGPCSNNNTIYRERHAATVFRLLPKNLMVDKQYTKRCLRL
jgi:hypothetical protein